MEIQRVEIERRLRGALGSDGYEQIGAIAADALEVIFLGEVVDAWWERRGMLRGSSTVPRIAFLLPGAPRPRTFDYYGRRGADDPDRCPLIAVFIDSMPVVLNNDHYSALRDLAGARLVQARRLAEALLARSSWAPRRP